MINIINKIIETILKNENSHTRDINISGSLSDHILIEFFTYSFEDFKKTKKQIIVTADYILFNGKQYDISEAEVIWLNHFKAYIEDKLTPEND